MKILGYLPDEDEMNQTEEHEFFCGSIIKTDAKSTGLLRKTHVARKVTSV